jgi:methionyl-tRNA formyltransferase
MPPTYLVAARRRWHAHVFHEVVARWPERWALVTERAALTPDLVRSLRPRYVFFPHWSWLVPPEILDLAECVCFHETALPFGRGGSPIQNLIARGQRETVVTALRMVPELDAGPVYLQRPLSLEGLAEEVYLRAARTIAEMMRAIADQEPAPRPQEGAPVVFGRRTPGDSHLPATGSLEALFDHLRMLDADGYPRAFADVGPWRLEFTRPALRTGAIEADVRITRRPDPEPAAAEEPSHG